MTLDVFQDPFCLQISVGKKAVSLESWLEKIDKARRCDEENRDSESGHLHDKPVVKS